MNNEEDKTFEYLKYRVVKTEMNTTYYNREGKMHREGGPAIEWDNGTKSWYINGKLHRVDGPAIERYDGGGDWWLDGIHLTEDEWKLFRLSYLR